MESLRDHVHAGRLPALVICRDVFNDRPGTVSAVASPEDLGDVFDGLCEIVELP